MDFDLDMQAALEADGEKLFQLTGVDHGPFFDFDTDVTAPCPCCFESCGYRGEWTTGWDDPGSFHMNPNEPCPECHGTGSVPCDAVQYQDDREDDYLDPGYERALDAQAGAA